MKCIISAPKSPGVDSAQASGAEAADDKKDLANSLSAKIEALEAAIARTEDQWEPDGESNDAYSGTRTGAVEWPEEQTQSEPPEVAKTEEPATFIRDMRATKAVEPDEEQVAAPPLDEETLKPVQYYFKAPEGLKDRLVIAVDPMLATGNSSAAAIDLLKEAGATDIRFLCLLAAPEGVARMKEAHPDVHIVTASLDRELNSKGYIMPGLGDAGDRMFGTK